MYVHISPAVPFVVVLCALLMVGGCSKEPSAEQKAADAAFAAAKTALSKGGYREARGSLLTAIRLEEGLGRKARLAESQRILGDIYAATASFDSALLFYASAAEEYRNLADRQAVRAMTLMIASLYRVMGEDRKAYTLCADALRLTRVFNDAEGVREIEWVLLPICRAIGEREEEAAILADLTKQYGSARDAGKLARVFMESGVSDFQRVEYDQAIRNFQRATSLADQVRDSVLGATTALHIAMAYEAGGDGNEAIQRYADALKRVEKLGAATTLRCEMLTRVGNFYLRNHQPAEAKRFYRAAVASAINAGNNVAEGYLFVQLGHCDAETASDAALISYQSALQLFKGGEYAPGVAYAQWSIGALVRKGNQTTQAIDYLKASIEQSESILLQPSADDLYANCERAYCGPVPYPAYDELADLLLQTGRYDEAFWFSERKNSNALFRAVSSFDPAPTKGNLTADLAQFQHIRSLRKGAELQLRRLLSASTPQQKELVEEVKRVLDQTAQSLMQKGEFIVKADRTLEPFVKVSGISPGEIQRRLPAGAAMVMYVPAKRSLYTFVVTNVKSVVQLAAMDRDRLTGLVRDYAELMHSHEATSDSAKALPAGTDPKLVELTRLLSEVLIRPIDNEIGSVPELLVVLPPELPWLPVHALKVGLLPSSPYVAERQLVVNLPYAGVLMNPVPQPSPVRDVVGFGYSGMSSWDVEYELRDIRAFYKDARLYFSQQATLEMLEKEHADVLHITGEFNCTVSSSANSFVVLSDGKSLTTSSKILLGELLSLPAFPTVVVSNIFSGPNRIDRTVPYIFLANGGSSVIVNAVTPLRKTKKFFGEAFYTSLLGGSSSRGAFRKVQLEMIKNPEYASPFFWAPFFLWGR